MGGKKNFLQLQCGKLNFWSIRLKTDVLYMFYTKFRLPRSIFYLPSSKCSQIGERASISFPQWTVYLIWTHCCIVMPYNDTYMGQNGNGLLPDVTKPIPEPVLTYHQLTRTYHVLLLYMRTTLQEVVMYLTLNVWGPSCLVYPGVRDKRRVSEIDLSQPSHETAFWWRHNGPVTSQLNDQINWRNYPLELIGNYVHINTPDNEYLTHRCRRWTNAQLCLIFLYIPIWFGS